MDYDMQIHYMHGVPRTRAAVAERISLAFRVKMELQPPKPTPTAASTGSLAHVGQ